MNAIALPLMITAVFVSIGPLLYLVVRGFQDRKKLLKAGQEA